MTSHPSHVDSLSSSNSSPVLSVQGLTIKADNQLLVDALSFDLYQGETVALVGESGSGKTLSTLALLGLLPRSLTVQGQATLESKHKSLGSTQLPIQQLAGETSKHYKRREAAFMSVRGSHIGIIFQEPMSALNPLHTVIKQLSESLSLAGVPKSQIKSQAINYLDDVNIKNANAKLRKYPHELSGGERQRVMIAIALAQKPDVLIADEPTTALDADLRIEVLGLLDSLKQKHGMALLLISHDLQLVRRHSHHVLIMKEGKTLERGPTEAIFISPQTAYTQALITQDYGKPLTLKSELARDANTANNNAVNAIEVKALSVQYPIQQTWFGKGWTNIVEDISFNVQRGHCLGIVGESGSGKSTIAFALTKLLSHQAKVSGNIIVNGTDLNSLSKGKLRDFRSTIQLVFQDPFASINPRFTVMQIVEEGLLVKGISKLERAHEVLEALRAVNLASEIAQRYPHELSGGQRQRVALARALIMQPHVLILDEPTSSLDSQTQVAIVALLCDLQANLGLSYIFISHDLTVVRALCQYIMVIKEGRCVSYGENIAS